jgi:hypothetical protein
MAVKRLIGLSLGEVSSVDRAANPHARVMLMKRDNEGEADLQDLLTPANIEKVLRVATEAELPRVVKALFDAGAEPIKQVVDLLNSMIVKRPGDRSEHDSYLKSFIGPSARSPTGREILKVWHENDQALAGCLYRKRGPNRPKAIPDTGDGKAKPVAVADDGEGTHADKLKKLATDYKAANKCTMTKAYEAVTKTAEGRALRQQDTYA